MCIYILEVNPQAEEEVEPAAAWYSIPILTSGDDIRRKLSWQEGVDEHKPHMHYASRTLG